MQAVKSSLQKQGRKQALFPTTKAGFSSLRLAKDRTETLGKFVKPEFDYIYSQIKSKQSSKKTSKKGTINPESTKKPQKATKNAEKEIDSTIADEANPFNKPNKK